MRRAFIDANIAIRYLTNEPGDMAREVKALFAAAERGEVVLLLDEITVAEIVWVLSSFYKFDRRTIQEGLISFIAHPGIAMHDKQGVMLALMFYAEQNVDFVDALLSVHMDRAGVHNLVSYDRDFDRLPGVRRHTPEDFLASA